VAAQQRNPVFENDCFGNGLLGSNKPKAGIRLMNQIDSVECQSLPGPRSSSPVPAPKIDSRSVQHHKFVSIITGR
jgi:hypothetical protein